MHSGHGSTCGFLIPVLLRSGAICSFKDKAYVTSLERFTCLGIPVYNETRSIMGSDCCHFDPARLSYAEANQLTGNAMHLHAISAWMAFIFAHIVRRPSEGLLNSARPSILEFVQSSDDEDAVAQRAQPAKQRRKLLLNL